MKSAGGIDSLSFYTSRYVLDLATLAQARGIDPDKYTVGLGQERMSVAPPDEDVVTLAANSAKQALEGIDVSNIGMLLVATESGIDQSKSLGVWVHNLLNLPKSCRVIELKQACYAGCAALQLGLSYIHQHPEKKVLVIATDIARYGLHTPGEPTQGCAAASFVLSSTPKLIAFEPEHGVYTSHVMDFWRPNYSDTAFVDGKFSTKIYIESLEECWKSYCEQSGRGYDDHFRFCYHLPFVRMAQKAHERLSRINGKEIDPEKVADSFIYSRQLGNSYTASLFIGLASLLENSAQDLTSKRIGLFSYGSGCVAEFFSGIVQPNYKDHLHTNLHNNLLTSRTTVSIEQYEAFFTHQLPIDGSDYKTSLNNTGSFRLTGVNNHERLYAGQQNTD